MSDLPKSARAVVIGGGVIGASVAYHLAKQGWQEVLLLERKQFSCGTTWHAAGLVGTLRNDIVQAKLAAYARDLIPQLEKESGQATGFRQVGSISLVTSAARREELLRLADANIGFGTTHVDWLTPDEIHARCPIVNTEGLLGGTWVATDGYISPVDLTQAFIRAARKLGAHCMEGVRVTGITQAKGKVSGVETDQGVVLAEYVVNCAGMWARELAGLAGVRLPLQACEHYYAVTEKLPDLPADTPVLRDYDIGAYIKADAGSLLVGGFEREARAWGQQGIPEDFCFTELEGHFEEQMMPILELACQRLPLLENVGWRKFFCGPESFTPDDRYHLGEAPELKNFYVAAGLNSIGIQMSGGIGKALAEWMEAGRPTMDLWAHDLHRVQPFQNTPDYLERRVTETLGLLYDHHYPYRQMQTARGIRYSPLHRQLKEHNACFGEAAGWERANWFAPAGEKAEYQYSFKRQNWFEFAAEEHKAFRERVALFDQSSFSKYLVQGADSCAQLQKICTADIDMPVGKMIYTFWLDETGGIVAELTVLRLAEDRYMIISGAAQAVNDMAWLKKHIDPDSRCEVSEVTEDWAVLGVMGPRSRELLTPLINADIGREAMPFGTVSPIDMAGAAGWLARVSFVGELGFEVYVPGEAAGRVFDQIWQAGEPYQLKLAGMHALDNGRLEKKFLHYGADVARADTPLECGHSFVCAWDKGGFIGCDALLKQRERGDWRHKRLVQFLLKDPAPLIYHNEPIRADGQVRGYITSGGYGHTLGGAVGLGYVQSPDEPVTAEYLAGREWVIRVEGEDFLADAGLGAFYDPGGERMRG